MKKNLGNKIDLSQFELTETGEFTCYGNIYNFLDHAGDISVEGCFDESIKYHKEMGTMPKFLFNHDDDQVVGKWISMEADENGLLLKGKINMETELGRRIYQNLKAGDLDSFSIQYEVFDEEEIDGVNYLKVVHVVEVSVVTFPCNEASLLVDIKKRFNKEKVQEEIKSQEQERKPRIFKNSDLSNFAKRLSQLVRR